MGWWVCKLYSVDGWQVASFKAGEQSQPIRQPAKQYIQKQKW